nr:probable protein S-acyltransferase 15 [Ipomoea batatas]GMC97167.1 probable protein S-acyltransferase 15 [Ipomoea batatas]GMD32119.1 probable protein S-acyltransferase 15 [Ipomoea batatas]GMD33616.1 probable protein S-acyltransferase 15 [Ipomoea batatas]GMD35347.1 probable protein S-acyltransferase 15 [Ipomoea batatas]
MKLARFLSIPILSVLFLVGVLYYVTVFIFIDDWLSLQTSAGSLNALIFTFFASLCIFSYFVCVLKDPGTVPSSYVPDVEENQLSDQESGRIVRFFLLLF